VTSPAFRARPGRPRRFRLEAIKSEFERKFGTTNCERLIGCRLDTPEGQRFLKENQLREKKCQEFTREAAGMASGILTAKAPAGKNVAFLFWHAQNC
jgi:hypothetical protein